MTIETNVSSIKLKTRQSTDKVKVSGFSKDIKVTVQTRKVACKKIIPNNKSVTLKEGESVNLEPALKPITCIEKIRYSSSNKAVATVSGKGEIVAKKKGKATITVTVGKKKAKCKVKVN